MLLRTWRAMTGVAQPKKRPGVPVAWMATSVPSGASGGEPAIPAPAGHRPMAARSGTGWTGGCFAFRFGRFYGLMVTVTVPFTMLPCASCTWTVKLKVPA